jgi:hypothetical protein
MGRCGVVTAGGRAASRGGRGSVVAEGGDIAVAAG